MEAAAGGDMLNKEPVLLCNQQSSSLCPQIQGLGGDSFRHLLGKQRDGPVLLLGKCWQDCLDL